MDLDELRKLTEHLPRFEDGRINYTQADVAPVINAAVFYKDELLISKRSEELTFYPGLWNGVSGFIDEIKPLEQVVMQELSEELGFKEGDISRIAIGEAIEKRSKQHSRLWLIFPALVELNNKPAAVLDREHSEYAWINPKDLGEYEILSDFDRVVDSAQVLR